MSYIVPVRKAQWSMTGAPDGLSIDAKGRIVGTPTEDGLYTPEVTVKTSWGTATKTVSLRVNKYDNIHVYAKGASAATWGAGGEATEDGLFQRIEMPSVSALQPINGGGFLAKAGNGKKYVCGGYDVKPNGGTASTGASGSFNINGTVISTSTPIELADQSIDQIAVGMCSGSTSYYDGSKTYSVEYSQNYALQLRNNGECVQHTTKCGGVAINGSSSSKYYSYGSGANKIIKNVVAIAQGNVGYGLSAYALENGTVYWEAGAVVRSYPNYSYGFCSTNIGGVVEKIRPVGARTMQILRADNTLWKVWNTVAYSKNNATVTVQKTQIAFDEGVIEDFGNGYVLTTDKRLYLLSNGEWIDQGLGNIKKIEGGVFLLTKDGKLFHKGKAINNVVDAHTDEWTQVFENYKFYDIAFPNNTTLVAIAEYLGEIAE